MDMRGSGPPRASIVPILFAFIPGGQHAPVGSLPAELDQDELIALKNCSDRVAATVQETASIVGLACRTRRREILLVGTPVAAKESISGRAGLVVTFGAVCSRPGGASPELYVQLLAALELGVAAACSIAHVDLAATANELTRTLQAGSASETIGRLQISMTNLGNLFSALLPQTGTSRVARYGKRRSYSGVAGATWNNRLRDPAHILCSMVVSEMVVRNSDQIAYCFELDSLNLQPDFSPQATTTRHAFLYNLLILCQNAESGQLKSRAEFEGI